MSCVVEGRVQRSKGIRLAPQKRYNPRGHVNRRRQGISFGCQSFHKNIEMRNYHGYLKLRDGISGKKK